MDFVNLTKCPRWLVKYLYNSNYVKTWKHYILALKNLEVVLSILLSSISIFLLHILIAKNT